MLMTILSIFLVSISADEDVARQEARRLIDTIEAIQQPIEDFRCEFEGSSRYQGNLAERQKGKLGEDGLYETFSGIFLWRRGGDTHSDTLNRRVVDNVIAQDIVAIRTKERQAEEYHRLSDAPAGNSVIKSPKEVNSWRPNCLGWIFLIDKLKAEMEWDYNPAVSDEVVDGRPLKVLTFRSKVADTVISRYWIDLNRSGHVVRAETYMPKDALGSHMAIKLDSFKIGDTEIWMPVHGLYHGYGALLDDNTPIVVKEPTCIVTMNVVGGTMEFNKKIGPEGFRVNYKMGTPISDELKKLKVEFGQQKIGQRPTKAEAENKLKEQVAQAEARGNELVVATGMGGFDWWPWAVGGLVIAVLGSLTALQVQRRSH